ncbi:hypothetical protein NDU88_011630 [Pleurodeles waltl]|uniref:Uncharacterized protein n=1 Tax=Pleurodeles waltl TaxID=8319 RepID=A0AAV7S7G6_PLEWA|nr:hypothetical protein NDU88_011630 [Pleurodeles waltl]
MKNGARSSIADIFKALSMVKEVPELRKKEPDEMCVPPSGEQQKRVTMEGDPNPPSGVTKDLVTQDLPSLWLWASVLREDEDPTCGSSASEERAEHLTREAEEAGKFGIRRRRRSSEAPDKASSLPCPMGTWQAQVRERIRGSATR